ncbi:histone deacetylase complex subunit SAP130-like isoform X1 [Pomacea canaliculata]|uniref:histone deacetylase complex subunit SAP130-like isoform X1 n=1 Tax=Pomacea canaliculata TaxID=400727 RepID=UPI000D73D566|nr:histone deacetylase complex subunit SAP130-like isoform X1 [Pomacea canaliculata]XP_025080360.1 histone deacetylase complex subunit SAP130-like isoform X1 [Pomacea canaliculata]
MQKPDVKTSAKSLPILPSTAAGNNIRAIPISTSIPSGSSVNTIGGNVNHSRPDTASSHVTTTVSASSLPLTPQPSLIHIQNRTVVGGTIGGPVPVNILRGATQAASVMSQQHPTSFPSHLPRGAVAASALTLTKNSAAAVLRTGSSVASQIPAAPSVPSVSVSVPVQGLASALSRSQVISAIRTTTPPAPRSTSPAVSISDHTRANLIVHGGTTSGTTAGHISGQPVQITLTQRVGAAGQAAAIADSIKPGSLVALGPKTVHVAQSGQPHPLVQHPKVATGLQSSGVAGVAVTPQQLQQQAALAASKPGALAVNAAVPAITINSLSAPVTPATVVAPAAAAPASIPIAKVTPQRQQTALSANLQQTPLAIQTVPSGSEFSNMPDISAMATQSGASQLLLSQTHRGNTVTMATSSAIATLATSAATSLNPQSADRSVQQQHPFNLTATPGQGQDSMWLQHILYQAQAPLVPGPHNASTIMRPATFFIPRPSLEQNKLTSQTPNLAASLSHPLNAAQPAVLFNPRMMVDSLRQPLPLSTNAAFTAAAVTSAPASLTVVNSDSKPVISLSTNTVLSGLQTSIITTSTTSAEHSHPASSSLHIATSIQPASAVASALSPGLNLAAALPSMPSRPTVASSIIAAATAQQVHATSGTQPQPPGTPGGTSSNTNPGSSPRPSILRKRTIDGNVPVPRRPNFNLMSESQSPRPDNTPLSNVSSPKTPATENSQSSTDTALSSNDATTPTHNSHSDLKIKQEPGDTLENGTTMVASPAVSFSGSMTDASPRKRARKQLFDVSHRNVNEELKDNTSTDDEIEHQPDAKDDLVDGSTEKRNEYIDEDGVRWTTEKTKPSISILGEYNTSWKPRCNHFLRYSDVRPKDDRRPTVNELANQRGILQKSSGWKLFHMAAQLEDLVENEQKTHQKIAEIKASLAARVGARQVSDPDFNVLQELTQANLQRCQLISDQLMEAKQNMLNILNHRPKIQEIIHKNLSKRPIKKKERT